MTESRRQRQGAYMRRPAHARPNGQRGARAHRLLSLLALALSLLMAGCGEDPLASMTAKKLQVVGAVYQDYAAAKGSAPANESELKTHLDRQPAFVWQAYGVDSANQAGLLVSDRDKQSFAIHYGAPAAAKGGRAGVLACEREGKSGKRLAVFADLTLGFLKDDESVEP
jgi:hypothetical protein